MDVKFALLNGDLHEEVYIEKPEGFIYINDKNIIFELRKVLYGLKDAPHEWYYHIDRPLQRQGFKKGFADNNLYIKYHKQNILVLVAYVDDIIFGSNVEYMSQRFSSAMKDEF